MRLEQFVEVEYLRHFTRDFGERLERVRVIAFLLEHARVRERLRDVDPELRQNLFVAVSLNAPILSLSRLSAPITLLLRRSGTTSCDNMFRTARGTAAPGECRSPGWPSLFHRGADDALANLEAKSLRDADRVTIRVCDAQRLLLLVEQIDREALNRVSRAIRSGSWPAVRRDRGRPRLPGRGPKA